jgi:hypothetical protein
LLLPLPLVVPWSRRTTNTPSLASTNEFLLSHNNIFHIYKKHKSWSSRSNNTRSRRIQLCNNFTNPSQYPTTSSRKHALLNSHRCFERALHWCFGSDFDRYCYHNHHPHRHLVPLNCHCKYSLSIPLKPSRSLWSISDASLSALDPPSINRALR